MPLAAIVVVTTIYHWLPDEFRPCLYTGIRLECVKLLTARE